MGRYHAFDRQSALRGRGERSDNSDSLRVVRTIGRQNTLPVGRRTVKHRQWVAARCQNYRGSIVGRYHTCGR